MRMGRQLPGTMAGKESLSKPHLIIWSASLRRRSAFTALHLLSPLSAAVRQEAEPFLLVVSPYPWRMQSHQTALEVLFPGLAPEERDEARHALRRYLSFILRLHARIASDPAERKRLAALTAHYRPSS